MKKITILAIPALIMTACTAEEDVISTLETGKEVCVSASMYGVSRNEMETSRNFPTTNTMNLSALYTNAAGEVSHFVWDQEFKYDTSNSSNKAFRMWDGQQFVKKYYPREGSLQWIGYSTSVDHKDVVFTLSDDNTMFQTYEIDFNGNSLIEEDVLYSLDMTQTCSGALQSWISFKHAMASIKFAINAATSPEVRVQSIMVNGLYDSGKLTVDRKEMVGWTPEWTFDGLEKKNVAYPIPADADPSKYEYTPYTGMWVSYFGRGHMLVPANQCAESFTINYTVDGEPFSRTLPFPSTTWKAATDYQYSLSISFTEISVRGEIAHDWTDNYNTVNNF